MSKIENATELNADRFARFLTWLDPDTDRAADEYERVRFRLTTFFAGRRCMFADNLADEVINRVAIKAGTENIENKTAYFFGVARNVLLESMRKEKFHINIDEISIAARPEIDDNDRTFNFLDKCLDELGDEKRRLILEYMSESKRAKIDLHRLISKSLNTTRTALRMRIVRIKQELRQCLQQCMA